MEFLQHFLPGQPLETNAQTSVGTIARRYSKSEDVTWNFGVQLEWMSGELQEFQEGPTVGSAFLVETRPSGLHYDYDVDSFLAAAFYDLNWRLNSSLELVHSLRLERLSYDYDNNHLVGNTRDDGSQCGFGGCLYTRPADREDTFTDLAGRLGLDWSLRDTSTAYVVAGVGFRAPQATELYRLQSGQAIADIDSERLASFEIGYRLSAGSVSADLAAYVERTQNVIFRDADGFNVSDGKTDGAGFEFAVAVQVSPRHLLDLTGTYARHLYAFDRSAALGEVIEDGNDVDTAPRWHGSARWEANLGKFRSEVEVVYLGSHYTNAANTARYEGHTVANWRVRYTFTPRVAIFGRILNILDAEYADRADFAFGSHRYFPAMPRQVYLGVEFALSE